MPETPVPPPADEPWLEVFCSRHFPAWMAEHRVSLAVTTYQAGKLFLVGTRPTAASPSSSAPSTAAWACSATARRCG
jgi:hypothetical protein